MHIFTVVGAININNRDIMRPCVFLHQLDPVCLRHRNAAYSEYLVNVSTGFVHVHSSDVQRLEIVRGFASEIVSVQ